MKRPRSGTTIIELVAILSLLSIFAVVLTPLLPHLLKDIPEAQRAASSQRQTDGVLRRVRQDMDRAVSLPAAAGDKRADGNVLLIQTAADTIVYEWAGETLTRMELRGKTPPRVWQMPDGVVRWRTLPDAAGPALEVQSAVKTRMGNRRLERLACAHVYYVGGLGPRGALEEQP